jgi:hypothetical protein
LLRVRLSLKPGTTLAGFSPSLAHGEADSDGASRTDVRILAHCQGQYLRTVVLPRSAEKGQDVGTFTEFEVGQRLRSCTSCTVADCRWWTCVQVDVVWPKGGSAASVQGLVPLALELWQGTALLLDACPLVLAAQSATQLEVAQDSMAQAAATALSEPHFQSLPGAAEFLHDMCLFLGFLSPAAQRAPVMAAALGMRLLHFAVRRGQVAVAQVLHACMGSTAGRKAMGAAGCGPVLSLQCREQMARLARRSGVQGMSEAVKGW